MDVALHDLAAQAGRRRRWPALLGAPAGVLRVPTDVTIAAGEPDELGPRPRARRGRRVHGAQAEGRHRRRAPTWPGSGRSAPPRPDARIRVDANQGWTPDEAIRVIRAIEDAGLDVEFVEQPVAADDVDGPGLGHAAVEHPGDGRRVGASACVDLDAVIAQPGRRPGQREARQVRRSRRGPRAARARPRRRPGHHRRLDDGGPDRRRRRGRAGRGRRHHPGERPRRRLVGGDVAGDRRGDVRRRA